MSNCVEKWKEKGKEAFSSNQYKKALEYYSKAFELVMEDSITIPSREVAVLLANRSACFFALKKFQESLEDARKCIHYDPTWAKGYYRLGNAEFELDLLGEALVSFGKALALNDQVSSMLLISERLDETTLKIEDQTSHLYFKQLYPGRDICLGSYNPITKLIHEISKGMRNLIYVIGDKRSKKCVIVDICWDIDGVVQICENDGMEIVGALITHCHFDHVGGKPPPPYDAYGIKVPGLKKLLCKYPSIPVFIGPGDIETVKREADIPEERIICTRDGEINSIVTIPIKFIHTPGHTPGGQCVLINDNRLLTGDTLFIGSCGRTDLPGGDIHKLYHSLQDKLSPLPEYTHIFPGHAYNGFRSSVKREKERGLLRPMSFEQFKQLVHGGHGVKI